MTKFFSEDFCRTTLLCPRSCQFRFWGQSEEMRDRLFGPTVFVRPISFHVVLKPYSGF
jgi:hypothetical protein